MTPHAVPPLNVLVVDDHPDTADALAHLLRLHGHRPTVAHTARESLEAADRQPTDVALLDIRLPDLDGWQVARWLREKAKVRGGRRILLIAVTGYAEDGDRRRSAEVGIDLYLQKPADPAVLLGTLERFGRGDERSADMGPVAEAAPPPAEPDLSPEILRTVAAQLVRSGTPAAAAIARHFLDHPPSRPSLPPADGLSEREAEVLKRIAQGYSNKEIAAALDVSVKTVETYKTRAMEKLGLHSRVDTVRYAVKHGWLHDGAFAEFERLGRPQPEDQAD